MSCSWTAGCTVEGYQSDITRTTVFGTPSKRQADVWAVEKAAQTAAFAAAQVGATCESVDAAARRVITDAGFGPDYKVPGLPHRTGHGIGMDGHEWTNFVRGNTTKLEPGMCFSDEPMIAIYGEFGIRLEDCLYITENGPKFFTRAEPLDRTALPHGLTRPHPRDLLVSALRQLQQARSWNTALRPLVLQTNRTCYRVGRGVRRHGTQDRRLAGHARADGAEDARNDWARCMATASRGGSSRPAKTCSRSTTARCTRRS